MTKREIFNILILGVFIGIVLGYSWRMFQIEPIINKEVDLLYRENRILCIENEAIKARIAMYEIGKKKKIIKR